MFKNDLVMCVKVNSEVLRENNNIVRLPFGCEYSVYLKSLSGKRAVVTLTVDGTSIIDDLVINPFSSINIERFFNENNDIGHKLKFIEKTSEIENYRGNKAEDGILTCIFSFEKKKRYVEPVYYDRWANLNKKYDYSSFTPNDNGDWRNIIMASNHLESRCEDCAQHNNLSDCLSIIPFACNCNSSRRSFECKNDADGITVNGSISHQKFTQVEDFDTGEKYSMSLFMKGFKNISNKKKQYVTVKDLIICPTCGKKMKSNNNFCSRCGTNLQVI